MKSIIPRLVVISFTCIINVVSSENEDLFQKYAVSSHIAALLDSHFPELEDMHDWCTKNIFCPQGHNECRCSGEESRGVRKFSWLPGYLVKFGVSRVPGAQLARALIAEQKLDLLVVPDKYLYHMLGRPKDLSNANYLVIVQELDLDFGRSINVAQIRQCFKAIEFLLLKDIQSLNIIPTRDGKLSLIDFEAASFWGDLAQELRPSCSQQIFLGYVRFIEEQGEFLRHHLIEKDAYEFIVEEIKNFIQSQEREEWFNNYMSQVVDYIVKLPQPWPFDYAQALRKKGFLRSISP